MSTRTRTAESKSCCCVSKVILRCARRALIDLNLKSMYFEVVRSTKTPNNVAQPVSESSAELLQFQCVL